MPRYFCNRAQGFTALGHRYELGDEVPPEGVRPSAVEIGWITTVDPRSDMETASAPKGMSHRTATTKALQKDRALRPVPTRQKGHTASARSAPVAMQKAARSTSR